MTMFGFLKFIPPAAWAVMAASLFAGLLAYGAWMYGRGESATTAKVEKQIIKKTLEVRNKNAKIDQQTFRSDAELIQELKRIDDKWKKLPALKPADQQQLPPQSAP